MGALRQSYRPDHFSDRSHAEICTRYVCRWNALGPWRRNRPDPRHWRQVLLKNNRFTMQTYNKDTEKKYSPTPLTEPETAKSPNPSQRTRFCTRGKATLYSVKSRSLKESKKTISASMNRCALTPILCIRWTIKKTSSIRWYFSWSTKNKTVIRQTEDQSSWSRHGLWSW